MDQGDAVAGSPTRLDWYRQTRMNDQTLDFRLCRFSDEGAAPFYMLEVLTERGIAWMWKHRRRALVMPDGGVVIKPRNRKRLVDAVRADGLVLVEV